MTDKEKEIGMSIEETEDMGNFAAYLYDKSIDLSEEEKKLLSILRQEEIVYKDLERAKLSPKELFLLGFLRGREFTLEQLGVWDVEEDDDEYDINDAPEIIKQYLQYEQQKKK